MTRTKLTLLTTALVLFVLAVVHGAWLVTGDLMVSVIVTAFAGVVIASWFGGPRRAHYVRSRT
jgi:hypothetical protein